MGEITSNHGKSRLFLECKLKKKIPIKTLIFLMLDNLILKFT